MYTEETPTAPAQGWYHTAWEHSCSQHREVLLSRSGLMLQDSSKQSWREPGGQPSHPCPTTCPVHTSPGALTASAGPRAPFMACKTRLPSSPPHPPFLRYLFRIFKSSHSQLKLLLYSRAASLKSTTEQPGKGRETSSVQYSSESSTLMLQLLNTTFLCRTRH